MKSAAVFLLFLMGAATTRADAAQNGIAVLLLAHGGDPAWNASVESLRQTVSSWVPCALALGMADPDSLQQGVDELEKNEPETIVVVPLFINSSSEVLDQTRYSLGLTDKPSEILRAAAERMKSMPMPPGMPHHRMNMFSLQRVSHRASFLVAPALDASPFVSSVLLERAKALSREPSQETVVLVAHGPVDDAAVKNWEADLAAHAAAIKKGGGFLDVQAALLRDDAAPEVRAQAVAELRAKVEAAGKSGGRALVVPVLIARGGIEDKIPRDLKGLTFSWSGDALLPQPGFDAWVLNSVQKTLDGR
ncbi:MAG: sirohydrochlorin chelatase [Elusimicrobiota bacterium]